MSSFERRQCSRKINYRGANRAAARVLHPAWLPLQVPRWYTGTRTDIHTRTHTPYMFETDSVAIKERGLGKASKHKLLCTLYVIRQVSQKPHYVEMFLQSGTTTVK